MFDFLDGQDMLAVLDPDQTLPENTFAKEDKDGIVPDPARMSGYYCAQDDMVKAVWRKVKE